MDIKLRIKGELLLTHERLKKGPTRIYLGQLEYMELEFYKHTTADKSFEITKAYEGAEFVLGLRIYRVDTLHHIHVSGC